MSNVSQLEESFAEKVGVPYAIAMNSGTSTLHASLLALGIGPGDEVIVPALGPIMTSAAVIQASAEPVFCDVEPLTFTMDSRACLAKLITPNTQAIISVSLYGLPSRLDEILEICRDHELAHIIDNAQCFLSTFKGRPCEDYADAVSYSFESSKHINTGEGGMVTTLDHFVAKHARQYGNHGFAHLTALGSNLFKGELQQPGYDRHEVIGWNYRMPEVVAKNALKQVKVLEDITNTRVKVAEAIRDVLKDYPFFSLQVEPKDRTNSYWCVAAVYHDEVTGIPWSTFYAMVVERGGSGIYGAWLPPYKEQALEGYKANCPGAEYLSQRLMQIPNNYTSEEGKIQADILREVCEEIK